MTKKTPTRIVRTNADINTYMALLEIGFYSKYENPLVIINTNPKDKLVLIGSQPFSDFIFMDKIPEGMDLGRYKSAGSSGVFFSRKGQMSVRIFYSAKMCGMITMPFVESVKEVLKEEYGVDVHLDDRRAHSNDIVFELDGKIKKFCGMLDTPIDRMFIATITFQFDGKKVPGLWKLDHDKFVKKVGKIKKIEEVVGGLRELNPKISEEVVDKIVQRLCVKMNWEPTEGEFNDKENAIIEKIKKVVSTEDWILRAKR